MKSQGFEEVMLSIDGKAEKHIQLRPLDVVPWLGRGTNLTFS